MNAVHTDNEEITMKASELLDLAAGQIERNGKASGHWIDSDYLPDNFGGKVPVECAACVVGALAIQLTGGVEFSPNFVPMAERETLQTALRYVVQHVGLVERGLRRLDAIIYWSDSHSQDEVVVGLRGAAELARSEGS